MQPARIKITVSPMASATWAVSIAILAFAPTAGAAELAVPKAHPEVAMDIPEGWAMEQSDTGFEMRSPEKNSIIIGRTLGRDKAAVEAWRKEAAAKMQAFGINFDVNAKAPVKPLAVIKPAETAKPGYTLKPGDTAKPTETAKPNETAKAGDTVKPGVTAKPTDTAKAGDPIKSDKANAFTTNPDVFTFSGAPSLKTPGTEGSNDPVQAGESSVEALTGFGATVDANLPKLRFRAVQYYGTSLAGKPVDVQLLIYNLPNNRLFLMMQESGADDGRAVTMARSVRPAH